ncbi:unnamed protein product [Didymodactylos carnosus]|uniref:Phospholipid scramblase n=1 Tax=Didymodactylos carnosus TaxID=1234261 RepID=A0A814I6B6_9BILA|nr:unnamed protein product [Didymodactylos carnosus]CAF3791035.1 unnamed protein product [Didymodactylos carnosus]
MNELLEIIRIHRNFKCCVGCCWCANADCCAHEVYVESPPGVLVGTVRQDYWRGHLTLRDATGQDILKALGPCCICNGPLCCCCENKFTLFTRDGQEEKGAIYKQYAGFVNEAFTNVEKYTIEFPIELTVQMKAVALATLFLVNFMYFAGRKNEQTGADTACDILSCLC